MELYKDEKCSKESRNADKCFYVLFTMNGKELKLDVDNCKHKAMCPYKDVRKFL
jgi:hypothetical protein